MHCAVAFLPLAIGLPTTTPHRRPSLQVTAIAAKLSMQSSNRSARSHQSTPMTLRSMASTLTSTRRRTVVRVTMVRVWAGSRAGA